MANPTEYHEARYVSVQYINERELDGAEEPADVMVLALSTDATAVFTGTRDQLVKMLATALSKIATTRDYSVPDEEYEDDAIGAPH